MRAERLHVIANRVISQTMRNLPPSIRDAIGPCVVDTVLMEDVRSDGRTDLEPDLLGLFEGCSRADPLPEGPEDLPRIQLFVDNIWEFAGGQLELFRTEVRTTLLHELAHYLGLNEAQVEEMGLG